jgi:hypothetical protein
LQVLVVLTLGQRRSANHTLDRLTMRAPVACFEPAHFADVWYRAWLPPFHRRVMIGKLREQYRGTPYISTDFKPLP